MEAKRRMDELRSRITGLSDMLREPPSAAIPGQAAVPAGGSRVAAAASPPWRQGQPSSARPSSVVLRSANAHARDAPLGGLIQKYRDAEAQWLKEKGKMSMAVNKERARAQKAEAELRRVQEQLAFRVGEVKHLKQAVKGRDFELQELQDRLREYELAEGGELTAQETVRQAQAERDELRASMAGMLQRLNAASDVISQADSGMSSMQAQLAAAVEGQRRAEQEAAEARAEAEVLREAMSELQWKCSLLKQLSDLTLKHNDAKVETLKQLLESESLLDAADGGGSSTEPDGSCPVF